MNDYHRITQAIRCPICGGRGEIVNDAGASTPATTCEICGGTGLNGSHKKLKAIKYDMSTMGVMEYLVLLIEEMSYPERLIEVPKASKGEADWLAWIDTHP